MLTNYKLSSKIAQKRSYCLELKQAARLLQNGSHECLSLDKEIKTVQICSNRSASQELFPSSNKYAMYRAWTEKPFNK